jgi:hypothetical protein
MIKKSAGHGRVVRRQPALQDLGAAGGWRPGVGKDVFQGERYAGKWSDLFAGSDLGIDARCRSKGALPVDIQECMYLIVDLCDAMKMSTRHFNGAQVTGFDLGRKISSRLPNDLARRWLA